MANANWDCSQIIQETEFYKTQANLTDIEIDKLIKLISETKKKNSEQESFDLTKQVLSKSRSIINSKEIDVSFESKKQKFITYKRLLEEESQLKQALSNLIKNTEIKINTDEYSSSFSPEERMIILEINNMHTKIHTLERELKNRVLSSNHFDNKNSKDKYLKILLITVGILLAFSLPKIIF